MDRKTWVIVIAVFVVFISGTAIFAYFYGKQASSAEISKEVEKRKVLQTDKDKLLDSLKVSQERAKLLEMEKMVLLDSLKNQKVKYEKINTKYNEISDIVRYMPTNEQVKFLSDWLSENSNN